MSEAEKIIKDMPFVKDGLDNFYGHQTVLNALNQALNLHIVSKRYYWLKADGTISNMWNEEDHEKYISEQDIKDAEKDGWQLIQINVC